jgi:hypothetical protein
MYSLIPRYDRWRALFCRIPSYWARSTSNSSAPKYSCVYGQQWPQHCPVYGVTKSKSATHAWHMTFLTWQSGSVTQTSMDLSVQSLRKNASISTIHRINYPPSVSRIGRWLARGYPPAFLANEQSGTKVWWRGRYSGCAVFLTSCRESRPSVSANPKSRYSVADPLHPWRIRPPKSIPEASSKNLARILFCVTSACLG